LLGCGLVLFRPLMPCNNPHAVPLGATKRAPRSAQTLRRRPFRQLLFAISSITRSVTKIKSFVLRPSFTEIPAILAWVIHLAAVKAWERASTLIPLMESPPKLKNLSTTFYVRRASTTQTRKPRLSSWVASIVWMEDREIAITIFNLSSCVFSRRKTALHTAAPKLFRPTSCCTGRLDSMPLKRSITSLLVWCSLAAGEQHRWAFRVM